MRSVLQQRLDDDGGMISKAHRKALRTIHGRLKDLDSPRAIAGSLGLALQGLDVSVNDIDLQTDQEGAYKIQKAFRDAIVRNLTFSEADITRSYVGELKVHGVKVEIMGA